MSVNKPKKRLKWLKNPLIYVPLIGISVYLIFFSPPSNNIVSDNDTKAYCTITESQETKLRLICWKSGGVLLEDSIGNRFVVDKEKIYATDSIVLKKFNPEHTHYIKMESQETLFSNMTIDEVVKKTGDYIYADVARGEYSFPHVIAVQGKIRHHGLSVFTGVDGKVTSVECGERTSSNWFGILPFYADIVSLNMFTAFSTPILQDLPEVGKSKGILGWLLDVVWNLIKFVLFILLYFLFIFVVFAIPLCIIFPILRLFSFIKSLPNWLIATTIWSIGFVIVYVITIAQVEGTHSLWLITLPINIFVGFALISYFYVVVDNARCPKCRKDKALLITQKPIWEHTYIEEREHSKAGASQYVGEKGGRKIYNQDIDRWITEREITLIEYLVTETCKHCDYTNQYNSKETEKGERVETDSWTDTRMVSRKIATSQTPTYSGDDHSITDGEGSNYDRAGDYDLGSDIVKHKGNSYKKRY